VNLPQARAFNRAQDKVAVGTLLDRRFHRNLSIFVSISLSQRATQVSSPDAARTLGCAGLPPALRRHALPHRGTRCKPASKSFLTNSGYECSGPTIREVEDGSMKDLFLGHKRASSVVHACTAPSMVNGASSYHVALAKCKRTLV